MITEPSKGNKSIWHSWLYYKFFVLTFTVAIIFIVGIINMIFVSAFPLRITQILIPNIGKIGFTLIILGIILFIFKLTSRKS
jgi:hypothetical protein